MLNLAILLSFVKYKEDQGIFLFEHNYLNQMSFIIPCEWAFVNPFRAVKVKEWINFAYYTKH